MAHHHMRRSAISAGRPGGLITEINDMYLAGNGYQKIKRRLEQDGGLTSTGKTLWHFSAIGHILKNRLYCGELGVTLSDEWRKKKKQVYALLKPIGEDKFRSYCRILSPVNQKKQLIIWAIVEIIH